MLNEGLPEGRFHMAIISTKRPQRVAPMLELLGHTASTWYVSEGEEADYIAAGLSSDRVRGCRHNISAARNAALRDARIHDACSIQASDDLRNVKSVRWENNKWQRYRITLEEAILTLLNASALTKRVYGGTALTTNAANYNGQPIAINKFVACDLIYVGQSCSFFDENVALKEDYDMTLQAILTHGGVFRCDNIMCDFPHRDNEGGANTYRTSEAELVATKKMFMKWGDLITPHPRRAGQIMLNYTQIKRLMNAHR
jgi:hypothetical protein